MKNSKKGGPKYPYSKLPVPKHPPLPIKPIEIQKTGGSKGIQKRNEKGEIIVIKKSDFGGVTDASLKKDRERAAKGSTGLSMTGPPIGGSRGAYQGTGVPYSGASKGVIKKAAKLKKKAGTGGGRSKQAIKSEKKLKRNTK